MTWARQLYPGEPAAIGRLQPDRLAEHLIVRELTRDASLTNSASANLTSPQVLTALAVLGRAAKDRPEVVDHLQSVFSQVGSEIALLPDEIGLLESLLYAIPHPSTSLAGLRLTLVKRLLMQRTKASEAQVATWLDVAGTAYSEVGQPAQALLATQEAVTLYRELAERYPDRYTPDLAASLRVLTGLLEADDAWPRWQVAIEELRSSMARAHFGAELAKASHQAVPDRAAAALSTAADQATMPDDAGPRDFTVRTRLLVREVAAAFPAAGLPPWVTDPLPDKHLNAIGVLEQGLIDPARLADALVEHADVVGEAGLLHTIELAETVFATDLGSVRGLVEDAQARGLEVAAAELRDLASLQDVVRAWIGTPTWTESVDYLREHPQLRDDAVGSMLASAPGPVAQQHTAILHLANGMDLTDSDTAASLVEFLANPEVAADGAIERLEAGEIDAMTTTVLANPQTLDTPRGPLLLAVLLAARGEPGNAREVIAAFGPTLNPTQRRARVLSLRKLLASNPPSEVATALPDLIALLDNPSPNQPAGASEPGPEPDQAG